MCPLHQHAFELDTGCSTTGAGPLRSYPVFADANAEHRPAAPLSATTAT